MTQTQRIVLYDGVCNFCNTWVQFIIAHDPSGVFKFVALQSEAGQALLEEAVHPAVGTVSLPKTLESMVLLEHGQMYTRSTAALRISRHLNGVWSWLYFLVWVPRPARDFVYRCVARYRYRFFGKTDTCQVPTAEIRQRFIGVEEVSHGDGIAGL